MRFAIAEHAAGDHPIVKAIADEPLDAAVGRNLPQIGERLYLETFAVSVPPARSRTITGR